MISDVVCNIIEKFEAGEELNSFEIEELIRTIKMNIQSIELLEKIIREKRHMTLSP